MYSLIDESTITIKCFYSRITTQKYWKIEFEICAKEKPDVVLQHFSFSVKNGVRFCIQYCKQNTQNKVIYLIFISVLVTYIETMAYF